MFGRKSHPLPLNVRIVYSTAKPLANSLGGREFSTCSPSVLLNIAHSLSSTIRFAIYGTSSAASRVSSSVPTFLNLAAISNVSRTVRSPCSRGKGGWGVGRGTRSWSTIVVKVRILTAGFFSWGYHTDPATVPKKTTTLQELLVCTTADRFCFVAYFSLLSFCVYSST